MLRIRVGPHETVRIGKTVLHCKRNIAGRPAVGVGRVEVEILGMACHGWILIQAVVGNQYDGAWVFDKHCEPPPGGLPF